MKYCVVCSGGELPFLVATEISKTYDLELVLIDGFFNDDRLFSFSHAIFNPAKAGKIISHMKKNGVTNVVIIGNAKMPNLTKLIPDFKGAKIITKMLLSKGRGDDAMLKIIAKEFEANGIKISSPIEFLGKRKNIFSTRKPTKFEIEDVKYGIEILDKISEIDVCQGVVVCEKRVISIEAIEGTDEMIKRSGSYMGSRFEGSPILIKMPKKTQDLRLDTPTIGSKTIEKLAKHGFCGLAVDLENIIIADVEMFLKKLSEHNIFFLDTGEINKIFS